MKRLIPLIFCMVLAGVAMVQSCTKPDAGPNSGNPVVPATQPATQISAAEIIQKALAQLATDTFEIRGGFTRTITNSWPIAGEAFGSHREDLSGPWLRNPFLGSGAISDSGKLAIGHTAVNSLKGTFYEKIFVNAAQDSFIGILCKGPNSKYKLSRPCGEVHTMAFHDDEGAISASDFSDMSLYKTQPWERDGFQKPRTAPDVEVQYYYHKDSLAVFEFYQEEYPGPNQMVTRSNTIRVYYLGKKK